MVFRLVLDGSPHEIDIVRRRPHLVLRIDGRERVVEELGEALSVDGAPVPFARADLGDRLALRVGGRTFEARPADLAADDEAGAGGQDAIRAPMPGAVIAVLKSPGDPVTRGETVLTIESMKLQTALVAPRDGAVAEILRREGETFERDETLARLVAAEG